MDSGYGLLIISKQNFLYLVQNNTDCWLVFDFMIQSLYLESCIIVIEKFTIVANE